MVLKYVKKQNRGKEILKLIFMIQGLEYCVIIIALDSGRCVLNVLLRHHFLITLVVPMKIYPNLRILYDKVCY